MNKPVVEWQRSLQTIKLPRWQELPDLELYMDQLVTLVERYTHPFKVSLRDERILSASMVNNYVKHKLIPPPIKKKYDKRHLARLIIITILKQAFDLPVVQKGLDWQIESDERERSYNQFCQQLEDTIHLLVSDEDTPSFEFASVDINYRPIQMATIALAAKLVAQNTLETLITQTEKRGTKND